MGVLVLSVLAVAAATLTPAASAQPLAARASLSLVVNYDYAGNITVTLPNGTPVGTHGGQPTVIPAGYYTVELNQPGCVDTPTFLLQGPGVNLADNLQSGELVTDSTVVYLQPNATYTWRSGAVNPPVYYTFTTSGEVLGTQPPPQPGSNPKLSSNKEANTDIVGSQAGKLARMLHATVTSAGRLALTLHGKRVTSLKAGRYTIMVTARRATTLTLRKLGHPVLRLTKPGFVGTRSVSVSLSAGRWLLIAGPRGTSASFAVVA